MSVDATSDLRRGLMGLICTTVYRGASEPKRWLADELAVRPFESMTDDALVDMAMHLCPEAAVSDMVAKLSPSLYEVHELALCQVCRDGRVLHDEETDRWFRCPNCNPREVVEPGEAPRSRRRRTRV